MSTPKRVLIAGGSGLIGKELSTFLSEKGFETAILSRAETDLTKKVFHWDPYGEEIDSRAFDGLYAVINLTGSTIIGKRWTKERKKILYDSRVKTTRFLVKSIISANTSIQHFIQASAMGIYGNRGDEVLTEASPAGEGFLAKLCIDWESSAKPMQEVCQLSVLRISLYLHEKAFLYKALSITAKFYIAASLGSGKQYVNYTSKDEFNLLAYNILANKMESGVYNAVGRKALTMNNFVKAFAAAQNTRIILPNIPKIILKLVLGEAASALTNSNRIESPKLIGANFHKYRDMPAALKALMNS